ncbi:hypothetical protein SAMN04488074_101943 [Lentzea albidocapillata subsp. violacea]|uniref:Uncharacterized protein n=1 Tax=Lentzea albidocapillata subsp. violacea TaxID=128104 RepID=A0A1G8SCS4_9PSEU|nr:hypothetical protein [Lentzea albidocapillata]SDJ27042.1 hypothetical protein SAMN04488074_101943 [Lentzea albidocapillata subsp. violacea]
MAGAVLRNRHDVLARLAGDPGKLDDPEHRDGVVATGLIGTPVAVPGIASLNQYRPLRRRLNEAFDLVVGDPAVDGAPSNYFEFPYDWRRANQVSALALKGFVDRELPKWRSTQLEELLDKEVLKNVRDNRPVHALLLLAEEDAEVLDLVLDAQEDPERTTDILRALASVASPHALTQAVTALEPHPLAALYKAVARVRAGDDRIALPPSDQRLMWIHEVTFLLPSLPQLARLIRGLATELD